MERRSFLSVFVDTGGRKACLNKASWQKLTPGVDVSHWGESAFLRGSIHGLPAKLYVGQDQTAGVKVVGKDRLSQGKLMLLADYNMEGCLLLVSDEITRLGFQSSLSLVLESQHLWHWLNKTKLPLFCPQCPCSAAFHSKDKWQ